jgi:hypothetical protein
LPLEGWIHHSALWPFLYDWQTVIAGLLAVGAALWTVWATKASADDEIAMAQKETDMERRIERRRMETMANHLRDEASAGMASGNAVLSDTE